MSGIVSALGKCVKGLVKCNLESCTVNSDCCSKETVIYMGSMKGGGIYNLQNLKEGVTQLCHEESPDTMIEGSLSNVVKSRVGEISEQACLGILELTRRSVVRLGETRIEEGYARFIMAAFLAGLNLEKKYHDGNPLSEKEYRKLEESVQEVQDLGDLVAVLFNRLKTGQLNLLAKSQKPIVEAGESFGSRVVEAHTFSDLSLQDRKIFFRVAKKYEFEGGVEFQSWILPQRETSLLLQDVVESMTPRSGEEKD